MAHRRHRIPLRRRSHGDGAAEFKGFFLGYSFDYALTDINRASSGSHEIFLGYKLKLDFSEKNKNKHKSIRIL